MLAPIAAHDPTPNMEANLNEQEEQNIQVQQERQQGWDVWPKELPALQQQIDLNQAPVAMEQDLNEAPVGEDPLEMIINPAQGKDQEEEQQIELPPPPQA